MCLDRTYHMTLLIGVFLTVLLLWDYYYYYYYYYYYIEKYITKETVCVSVFG